MSRYNKIRVACALALSVAIVLSGIPSVLGWSSFHNDKYRTGHIETSTTDIDNNLTSEELMDPDHYIASPVAAPSYAYYTSNNETWWYGDWRVVAAGDYCVVAYNEDLEKQWTFYTPQPVVATPAICVLTEWNPAGDDDEIEGDRAAIIITEGESGGKWPMIYVVNLESGKRILNTTVLPEDIYEGMEVDLYCHASPICYSEWRTGRPSFRRANSR